MIYKVLIYSNIALMDLMLGMRVTYNSDSVLHEGVWGIHKGSRCSGGRNPETEGTGSHSRGREGGHSQVKSWSEEGGEHKSSKVWSCTVMIITISMPFFSGMVFFLSVFYDLCNSMYVFSPLSWACMSDVNEYECGKCVPCLDYSTFLGRLPWYINICKYFPFI